MMVTTGALRRRGGVDALVGIGCTVFSVAALIALPMLLVGDPDADSLVWLSPLSARWWLLALSLLAQGLVFIWVRRAPNLSLIVAATVAFGVSWTPPGSAYGISNVAVIVIAFLAVVRVPLVRLRGALLLSGLLVAIGGTVNHIRAESLTPGDAALTALAQSMSVIGIPVLVGLFVRARREVGEARRNEQHARIGERDAQVQAAVARERTAMARELHDIAAHHLSGISLMAAVVDRQIDSAPEQARLGIRQIRAQSTAVLDDLRRLVGLLRDDTGGERSVETLGTVPELVATAQAQGLVELRVLKAEDRPLGTGVGPLAQLAAYRTIQEALTNAASYAPGAFRVVTIDDRDDAHAAISVINEKPDITHPQPSTGGFGLVGMRERAELMRADLIYGPTPAGGWSVHLTIPRETPVLPRLSDGDGDAGTAGTAGTTGTAGTA